MNSVTTRCLRLGLDMNGNVRYRFYEGRVSNTRLDVRFMSSNLRLTSRLSTTICVNLGSSNPAMRPPLEVIRFVVFSSLRVYMREQVSRMFSQREIHPLFGDGVFILQVWLDLHSIRASVGRRVDVEAPSGVVRSLPVREMAQPYVQMLENHVLVIMHCTIIFSHLHVLFCFLLHLSIGVSHF
jgi:hypothetical protein